MNSRTIHEPIIRMTNIEKHFGSVIALAGVSVDVFPGECHCLLGDNGAGKSTFIKTMSGVHKPTRGEIIFEGKPLHFDDPRDAIAEAQNRSKSHTIVLLLHTWRKLTVKAKTEKLKYKS